MNRRRLLLLMLGTLAAAPAAAQEDVPAPAPAPTPAPSRPRPRRRVRKPQPAPVQRAEPEPPPPAPRAPQLEAAPVPNRNLEAPRTVQRDEPSFSPSIIHRRLPQQGMAAEGAPSEREERLFFPAPGARLSVPFNY